MLFLRHKLPSRFVNNDPLFIGLALFSMVTDIARYGYNRLLVLSVWLVKQVSLETSYKYDNSTFHGYIYKKQTLQHSRGLSVRFALRPTQAWQLDRDVIARCQGPIEGLGSTPGRQTERKKVFCLVRLLLRCKKKCVQSRA